jgi:hypothetical protein
MLWILELLENLLFVGSHEGLADAIESCGQRRDDAKADAAWADERQGLAAHAQADILVLAALHDGVITRTERKELAAILPSLLARADVETTPEVLVETWNARQDSIESDQDLSRTVESLAHWLTAHKRAGCSMQSCSSIVPMRLEIHRRPVPIAAAFLQPSLRRSACLGPPSASTRHEAIPRHRFALRGQRTQTALNSGARGARADRRQRLPSNRRSGIVEPLLLAL